MRPDLRLCDLSFIDRQKFKWRVNTDTRLNASAKLVLDCLIMHVNCKYEECFPGQALICEETALTENTVRSALRSLRDAGWIVWRSADNGGHIYRILWQANPEITLKRMVPKAAADPSNFEGLADGGRPSEVEVEHPQNLRAKVRTGITKVSSLSTASPTKDCQRSREPLTSAEQQTPKGRAPDAAHPPLQEGSPEWWKDRVWNRTGEIFRERFYPTTSKAAFKSRLGKLLQGAKWEYPPIDRALLAAIAAEPALDAWEYVAAILRNRVEAGPDYSKPLVARGVM